MDGDLRDALHGAKVATGLADSIPGEGRNGWQWRWRNTHPSMYSTEGKVQRETMTISMKGARLQAIRSNANPETSC